MIRFSWAMLTVRPALPSPHVLQRGQIHQGQPAKRTVTTRAIIILQPSRDHGEGRATSQRECLLR